MVTVKFEEWTSFMQNSYRMYLVISNPFFVEVPLEKETDFTITPQKICKSKKKKKRTCKSKTIGIVTVHSQLSTTVKQKSVCVKTRKRKYCR